MDTGTKVYRNYFKIPFGTQLDCQYGRAYPVFRKMMYSGDVFKIHADLLIRYQPLVAPPMNNATATTRFFFVPLRLVEKDIEFIITGSKDGHLTNDVIPVCDSIFKKIRLNDGHIVEKHSLMDILYGIPAGLDMVDNTLLAKLDNSKASPAAYYAKGYYRCIWDYYRDENLYTQQTDFDAFLDAIMPYVHKASGSSQSFGCYPVNLRKDRITASLPWQLKANVPPTIDIISTGSYTPSYGDFFKDSYGLPTPSEFINASFATNVQNVDGKPGLVGKQNTSHVPVQMTSEELAAQNKLIKDYLNQTQSVNINNLGVNASQFRDMMAQTRIFERLARTGSRYTEYLRANFGVAPSDDTLQRAVYLGGFKTHIVTTEVVQTAADGSNPVGTLRGHGITHGTSTIRTYMAKEPGIILGIMDIKPETIYAQGVDRELTYRSRFDFLNPSFQHLSEQEVRKGEVYFATDTDDNGNLINDQTWGFQPYAEELRKGIKHVVGDMRDTLAFWNQALILSSRPSLNQAFIRATNHLTSYNRPFAVSGVNAYPMVVDFGGVIEAYRPLVRNGTPGLVDHN